MTMKPLKNKSLQLIMLVFLLIATAGCTKAQDSKNIKKMIADGAYLVDVRTPQEFAEGHVAGSYNIPVDDVAANLDKFKNKKNIIVFCRSGSRAARAKQILEGNGIKNVTNGGSWMEINAVLDKK